ncbi:hypothetical protein [Amycolatopsis regifaucium]|uniref:DUF1453 domain-containing protein n=1 Tax=Amycolatopsis regifaucium TaxID=546365 RepID=A0A154M734_9PSEU|nr:hypothetical protein [Amycolatopsis regifaucium]KZB80438.1 hypothetical protein AVL48_13170 [Amycolatopsis regifaucium]OKA05408.1 DUF1453 domain-containing protein [Amycolatopsis regifaucium]SFJ09728.1 hypothetical protein SAMN04489731_115170 [Amycolatopsis regifaucium]
MRTWLSIALVVAAVIVIVARRLRGEPLVAREVYGAPLVLLAIGVYGLAKLENFTFTDGAWLVLGSVVGGGLGAVRATTTKLFERDGVLWLRYTGWTFGVWMLSMVVNFGIGFLATTAGAHPDARPVTLSIGVSLLGEALVISRRAKTTGLPYAPPSDSVLSRR